MRDDFESFHEEARRVAKQATPEPTAADMAMIMFRMLFERTKGLAERATSAEDLLARALETLREFGYDDSRENIAHMIRLVGIDGNRTVRDALAAAHPNPERCSTATLVEYLTRKVAGLEAGIEERNAALLRAREREQQLGIFADVAVLKRALAVYRGIEKGKRYSVTPDGCVVELETEPKRPSPTTDEAELRDRMTILGFELHRLREHHGVTLGQLARAIGTTPDVLSSFELAETPRLPADAGEVVRAGFVLGVRTMASAWAAEVGVLGEAHRTATCAAMDRIVADLLGGAGQTTEPEKLRALGLLFRRVREAAGFGVKGLASALGVPTTTIAAIERGGAETEPQPGLHPAGTCTCTGEGRCEWCETNAAVADVSGGQAELLERYGPELVGREETAPVDRADQRLRGPFDLSSREAVELHLRPCEPAEAIKEQVEKAVAALTGVARG